MTENTNFPIKPHWGLLPDSATKLLRKREWDNTPRLKTLLTGERDFPLTVSLRPPKGSEAMSDLAHFQNFIKSWTKYKYQHQVIREPRRYRTLEEQQVPVKLEIDSIQSLVAVLGDDALARYQRWSNVIAPILDMPMAQAYQRELYTAMVAHLPALERLTLEQSEKLAGLLPQLTSNLGSGNYLRALPVTGIDTKFVEEHQVMLQALLDVIYECAVSKAGGLEKWLGCKPGPKGWLCIQPLCKEATDALGGVPVLQLSIDVLRQHPLPAGRILVVENLESGLALPRLPDCIAVIGGGRNLQWLSAPWLCEKQVAYWGDIDTWGLTLLAEARTHCPGITALMMDTSTVLAHEDRMVIEPEPAPRLPTGLSDVEQSLYSDLLSGRFQSGRLEQERLMQDYVREALERW